MYSKKFTPTISVPGSEVIKFQLGSYIQKVRITSIGYEYMDKPCVFNVDDIHVNGLHSSNSDDSQYSTWICRNEAQALEAEFHIKMTWADNQLYVEVLDTAHDIQPFHEPSKITLTLEVKYFTSEFFASSFIRHAGNRFCQERSIFVPDFVKKGNYVATLASVSYYHKQVRSYGNCIDCPQTFEMSDEGYGLIRLDNDEGIIKINHSDPVLSLDVTGIDDQAMLQNLRVNIYFNDSKPVGYVK